MAAVSKLKHILDKEVGQMTDYEINELVAMVSNEPSDAELRSFAKAVAAKEREACAKLCESLRPSEQRFSIRFWDGCTLCAETIRARGE